MAEQGDVETLEEELKAALTRSVVVEEELNSVAQEVSEDTSRMLSLIDEKVGLGLAWFRLTEEFVSGKHTLNDDTTLH